MKSKTLVARFGPRPRWIVTVHTTEIGFRFSAFKIGKLTCWGEATSKEACIEAARSAVEKHEAIGECAED